MTFWGVSLSAISTWEARLSAAPAVSNPSQLPLTFEARGIGEVLRGQVNIRLPRAWRTEKHW